MELDLVKKAQSLRGLIETEAAKPENSGTMSPVVVNALRERELFWLLVPLKLGGNPSVLGKYLVDSSVGAQHIIANAMSLIDAVPPIIQDWAAKRCSEATRGQPV